MHLLIKLMVGSLNFEARDSYVYSNQSFVTLGQHDRGMFCRFLLWLLLTIGSKQFIYSSSICIVSLFHQNLYDQLVSNFRLTFGIWSYLQCIIYFDSKFVTVLPESLDELSSIICFHISRGSYLVKMFSIKNYLPILYDGGYQFFFYTLGEVVHCNK